MKIPVGGSKLDIYLVLLIILITSIAFVLKQVATSIENTNQSVSIISPTITPLPTRSITNLDINDYLVEASEKPKITASDAVENHWSPDKKHFIQRVRQGSGNSFISIYDSSNVRKFMFNSCKGLGPCWALRRFHDFWLNNQEIAFILTDASPGKWITGTASYNLVTKKFKLLSDELYDFDSRGGFLLLRPTRYIEKGQLVYLTPENKEVMLGDLNGRLNGISPSGRYGVYLKRTRTVDDNDPQYRGIVEYYDVYIFPIKELGLSEQVKIGETAAHVGGGPTDLLFAEWSEDEKKVTINDFLIDGKELSNPLSP